MKVFKFGGASVKDAISVKNVVKVLRAEGYENTLVVISAMGKMTNAFEAIVLSYCNQENDLTKNIQFVKDFHTNIINKLFENTTLKIYNEVDNLFNELNTFITTNNNNDYNFIYDQIVGFGELLSTKIISSYLKDEGIENNWLDVRNFIITDSNYRDARVNWTLTQKAMSNNNFNKLSITQGFLGADKHNYTTTLGREGSDFTAAVFAYCLQAKNVTIWKDVEGVLNADPRYFNNTKLLHQISYAEALEMAFYGASVIHPKTIKPLENKNIPLYVRSFYKLNNLGTSVAKGSSLVPEMPCFIVKHKQLFVSISALDFSFMVEYNLSHIFKVLHNYKLKVNLIQNSALNFSICIEDKYGLFENFLNELKQNYNVIYKTNVSLYTVRHATKEAVAKVEEEGKVLLKQATGGTVQLIISK